MHDLINYHFHVKNNFIYINTSTTLTFHLRTRERERGSDNERIQTHADSRQVLQTTVQGWIARRKGRFRYKSVKRVLVNKIRTAPIDKVFIITAGGSVHRIPEKVQTTNT